MRIAPGFRGEGCRGKWRSLVSRVSGKPGIGPRRVPSELPGKEFDIYPVFLAELIKGHP
jgi:hypothetical protein